jgi:hypothetical protein
MTFANLCSQQMIKSTPLNNCKHKDWLEPFSANFLLLAAQPAALPQTQHAKRML